MTKKQDEMSGLLVFYYLLGLIVIITAVPLLILFMIMIIVGDFTFFDWIQFYVKIFAFVGLVCILSACVAPFVYIIWKKKET